MLKSKKLTLSAIAIGLMSVVGSAQANCDRSPVDPKGNVAKLKTELQQASNSGKPLRITGTYEIGADIKVFLRKDITVNATGAKFIASDALDGDMFSFDGDSKESKGCGAGTSKADFNWKGGTFDMIKARVSQVVPRRPKTTGVESSKMTADALSIRGVIKSDDVDKLGAVVIENIFVKATPSTANDCYDGGGDSGILLTGGKPVLVRNNTFTGIRDAGIYLTSGGKTGQLGDNYTYENNQSTSSCYGLTSKRGADNLVFKGNKIRNSIGAIGVTNNVTGRVATNVKVENNDIADTTRGISMYRANNVTIKNNEVKNLGKIIYGEANAAGRFGNVYEGVVLAGTVGNIVVEDNTITGINGSRRNQSDTVGIGIHTWDGKDTTSVTQRRNSFSRLDDNVRNTQND